MTQGETGQSERGGCQVQALPAGQQARDEAGVDVVFLRQNSIFPRKLVFALKSFQLTK